MRSISSRILLFAILQATLIIGACKSVKHPVPVSSDKRFVVGSADVKAAFDFGIPSSIYLTASQTLQHSRINEEKLVLRLIDSTGKIVKRSELTFKQDKWDLVCKDGEPRFVYSVERKDSLYFYERVIRSESLLLSSEAIPLIAFHKNNSTNVIRPTTGCGYAIISRKSEDDVKEVTINGKTHAQIDNVVYSPYSRTLDTVRFVARANTLYDAIHFDPTSKSAVFVVVRDSILESGRASDKRILEIARSSGPNTLKPAMRYREQIRDSTTDDDVTNRSVALSTDLDSSSIVMTMGNSVNEPRRIMVYNLLNRGVSLGLDKTFTNDECDRISGDYDLDNYTLRWIDRHEDDYIVVLENAALTAGSMPWYFPTSYPGMQPASMPRAPTFRHSSIPSTSDFRMTSGWGWVRSFVVVRIRTNGSIVWKSAFERKTDGKREKWHFTETNREDFTIMVTKPDNNRLHVVWRDFESMHVATSSLDLRNGEMGDVAVLGNIDALSGWYGLTWVSPTSLVGIAQASEKHPLVPFRINVTP